MMERGGLVLRVLALLGWLIWLAMPVAMFLFRSEGFPFGVWFGLMAGVFIISTMAWPVEKKKERDDRSNGSGY
jgi:uncharacterized protein (DUF58 family)